MRLEESVVVAASPALLWQLVGDPALYPQFMTGVTICKPLGRGGPGPGSRYSLRMQVGAAQVGGVIEIVDYQPEVTLAWAAVAGLGQRGRWSLRPAEGGTRVTLRVGYTVPGGFFAMAAEVLGARTVGANIRTTLAGLRLTGS